MNKDEIRYILFDRRGIKVDETTSKRKLKKWLQDGVEVTDVRLVKNPVPEDPSLFLIVELQRR